MNVQSLTHHPQEGEPMNPCNQLTLTGSVCGGPSIYDYYGERACGDHVRAATWNAEAQQRYGLAPRVTP